MDHKDNYDIIRYEGAGLPFTYVIRKTINRIDNAELAVPRWHEQMEIKLILNGYAEVHCGTKCYLVHAGDILVVNSCELHSICPTDAQDVCYHLLNFSPELLFSEPLSKVILPAFDGMLHFQNYISEDAAARELLGTLFAELDKKRESYTLSVVGLLSSFLAHMLRHHCAPAALGEQYHDMQRYAEKLEPAFAYIHERYREDIRIEMLAGVCGLSSYYFCRLFRLVTGTTVVSYLNEFRINKAETLIRSTNCKINEIARMVGFVNDSYFSRVFRKLKGYNPQSCREK